MNQTMPSMPSMPNLKTNSGEAQNAPQAPFSEESVGNSTDSDLGLNTPSHVEEDEVSKVTPQINASISAPSNEVKVPLKSKGGIKVVATRKGFYNQMRYKEGESFTIRSEEEFGEWMKCVEPIFEKKRLEHFKLKRLKARA